MISTRSVGLLIDTVVCLTLAKWETVSGRFGGYLSQRHALLEDRDLAIEKIDYFGFVLPHLHLASCIREIFQSTKLRGRTGLPSRHIESSDGKLAPRQRAPFVAIHCRKLPRHVGKDRREFLGSLTLCR